jgi:hypothetical protein
MDHRDIVIDPPLRGTWVIYNPPGHPKLAFDFLAEDERKSLYRNTTFLRHLVTFISVEDTLTWSSPVFSPVDGTVVTSRDGVKDRMKICFLYDLFTLLTNKPKETDGFGAFGGNHVMIRSGNSYVLLCHLRDGSVGVKKGDTVRAGQKLAEVGNSGSSIQPHLHLQVMSNDRYFPLFRNLLPFKISNGKVKHGDNWHATTNIEPRNGTHYAFESISRER